MLHRNVYATTDRAIAWDAVHPLEGEELGWIEKAHGKKSIAPAGT